MPLLCDLSLFFHPTVALRIITPLAGMTGSRLFMRLNSLPPTLHCTARTAKSFCTKTKSHAESPKKQKSSHTYQVPECCNLSWHPPIAFFSEAPVWSLQSPGAKEHVKAIPESRGWDGLDVQPLRGRCREDRLVAAMIYCETEVLF